MTMTTPKTTTIASLTLPLRQARESASNHVVADLVFAAVKTHTEPVRTFGVGTNDPNRITCY